MYLGFDFADVHACTLPVVEKLITMIYPFFHSPLVLYCRQGEVGAWHQQTADSQGEGSDRQKMKVASSILHSLTQPSAEW